MQRCIEENLSKFYMSSEMNLKYNSSVMGNFIVLQSENGKSSILFGIESIST